MKYNRALDLLCLAAKFQADGQHIKASQAFVAAVRDPSLASALTIVNSSNEKALAAVTAAAAPVRRAKAPAVAKKQTASKPMVASWPFSTTASNEVSASALIKRITSTEGAAPEEPMPGEELRVEPEENGDREVQEAFGEDDMSFLDDDGGELDLEAASEEDEEDAEEDAEDDKDEEDKEESATARFARFVRNTQAMRESAAAKKKKKVRK